MRGIVLVALACASSFGRDGPKHGTVGNAAGRLSIDVTGLVLPAGDTARLAVTLERDGAIYKLPTTPINAWPQGLAVIWSTSDQAVVNVQGDGHLAARTPGQAVVRAAAAEARDSAVVAVRAPGSIPILRARQISLGDGHTCAIGRTGEALCWGLNYAGALGNGAPRRFQIMVSPALVEGPAFAVMSAGGDNSCGLTAAGRAYCWGRNEDGEVGDGTADARARPTPIGGGPYAVLSVGFRHACGVAAREVYCWGRNDVGQVGVSGARAVLRVPTKVPLPEPVTAVAAGAGHTCALTGAGRAYCWGANEFGQLGRGVTSGPATPGPVAGGLAFGSITAGDTHTCGLTEGGLAYCWGNNASGRLGTGDTQARVAPTRVRGRGLTFATLSAGGTHTCGLTSSAGEAYCWGSNDRGQLGDDLDVGGPLQLGERNRTTPTRVATTLPFVQLVAGGEAHTCARTNAGEAHCWGLNTSGQLGSGRLVFAPRTRLAVHSSPVPVLDPR